MIKFKNLSRSPIEFSSPDWQNEIVKFCEADERIQSAAVEASEAFRARAAEAIEGAAAGYAGTAIKSIVREIPRYEFVKSIEAPDGKHYDAQIDLLMHTVDFVEI